MARRPIIAGNWKMNMTPSEAEGLIQALIPLVGDASCDVVICPPFVDLPLAVTLTRGTNIAIGAQNVHWAEKGAFTGEISANMLKSLGVQYAIVGHSERRQYFGGTDETVNKRARGAASRHYADYLRWRIPCAARSWRNGKRRFQPDGGCACRHRGR